MVAEFQETNTVTFDLDKRVEDAIDFVEAINHIRFSGGEYSQIEFTKQESEAYNAALRFLTIEFNQSADMLERGNDES